MLLDGKYVSWFRTSRSEGTGIVYLAHGRISGHDGYFVYDGSYEVNDDRFTATLTTKRYAGGPITTVFGLDEVEITLTGRVKEVTVWCSGTAKEVPGLQFEATLFPSREDAPRPEVNLAPAPFNAAKLPREHDARHRARNPFALRPSK